MGTLFRIGDRNIDRIKGDRWDYAKCYLDNDEYMEGNEDSIQDRIEEIKNEIEELENEDELRVHIISHFEDELYNLQCTNIEDCIKIWSSSYDILGIYPLSELKDLSNNGYGYVFLDEDIVDINELEDGYYQLIDEDNNYLLLKIEDNNEIELFEDYKDIIKEIGKKKYFKYFGDKISTLLEYYDDDTIFPMLENENEQYSHDIIEYIFDTHNLLTLEEYNLQAETNYTSVDDVRDDWYWTKKGILDFRNELYKC